MHPSSLENMKKARNHKNVILGENLIILDIGGRALTENTDRSYKSIFNSIAKEYLVADICNGPGVTHVMPGEYILPFDDDSIDLIVCGQVLEHVRNPFRSVAEMKRVLRKNGYMFLIAPSSGPRHDDLDCWRIMDDGFKAIAYDVGIKVIDDWVDRSAPDERSRKWADHVFIGQK